MSDQAKAQAATGWRRLAQPVGIVVGVGSFLAVLGPFGSATLGWPAVWFYWVALIAFGALFGFAAGRVMPRLAPSAPAWMTYAAAAGVVSLPVTLALYGLAAVLNADPGSPADLARTFFFVVVISSFVSAVAYVVDRLTEPRGPAAEAPPRASHALLEKLPVRLRTAEIFALEAEDHYLRVRTSRGDALILMRLTDAAAACASLDGARTHRSWWVARTAVVDAKKADGRGVLTLKDGTEAPVSRTCYPALREAGWF